VDETWISLTTFVRKHWAPKGQPATIASKTVSPRLAIIAAIDTDGRVWFALTQSNTDSNVFGLFLAQLCAQLDSETPGWRQDTTVLYDGARYHSSEETRRQIQSLALNVAISAPYSYAGAPIERLFGALKLGELNKARVPTGSR
jgi:hypothetical protein